ncbi:MAG: LysR family transcriptional regulator substrate-binding protein, partial [Betaproteobacteria bacterium]|nr:LysR family transcriptional regulator substrate-binding protein [Betaproteobacteria bacterium]
ALLKLRMVAASDLLCFMPIWWLENQPPGLRLVEIPVKGMTWRRHSGVIYRKDAYLSPAARRFIEILKTTAEEIAKE